MNAKELQRYRATRSRYPLIPAATILRNVKSAEPTIPLVDYAPCSPYGPRITKRVGYSQREVPTSERWIENTERAGLRFVDYADKIAPRAIGHQGWYTSEDCYEVIRGAVWQLPARNGRAQYVAGYEDQHNEGAALIDFDVIEGERVGFYDHWDSDYDARAQAAHAADSMAERAAEIERGYNRKWQAARIVEDYTEALRLTRAEHGRYCEMLRRIDDEEIREAIKQDIRGRRFEVCEFVSKIRETIAEFGDEILTGDFA